MATTSPKEIKEAKKAAKKDGVKLSVVDVSGAATSDIYAPESLFAVKASDLLLAQYVRVYRANHRQGTKSVKTRGEVTATTKKVYRQKGTGRARHGARTASLFVGGGVTHGPHPIDYSLRLNKKQKSKALLYSLSRRVPTDTIRVVDGIAALEPKAKLGATMVSALSGGQSMLIVYGSQQGEFLKKLLGNIVRVRATSGKLLNAYDVLTAKLVVFTKEGLDEFISLRS